MPRIRDVSRHNKKVSTDITVIVWLSNIPLNILALPEDDFLTDLLVKIVRRCVVNKYVSYEQLFFLTETQMFNIIKEYCKIDSELREMYTTFTTIKDIPIIDVGHDLKLRKVNPLVNGRRYY